MVNTSLIVLSKNGEKHLLSAQLETLTNNDSSSCSHLILLEQSAPYTRAESHIDSTNTGNSTRFTFEFLSNISREVRTHLNGMTGTLKLLRTTNLSGEQNRFLQIAESSTFELMGVADDLAGLAESEEGLSSLNHEPFSLHQLIATIMSDIAPGAINKELSCISNMQSNVPDNIIGDSAKIGTILKSLLKNAVKYTDKGSIELEIRCNSIRNRKTEINLRIVDTGHGMSVDKTRKLNSYFSSAHAADTNAEVSTRIETMLCRNYLRAINGAFDIQSELGNGSVFSFTFPVKIDEQNINNPVLSKTHLSGKRVLVVDDNKINQEYILELFDSINVTTDTAQLGSETLKKLENAAEAGHPFNVVVFDNNLPDTNGIDLAREISTRLSDRKTTLIMSTSNDQVISKNDIALTGLTAVLTKPIRSSSLFDILITKYSESAMKSDKSLVVIYIDEDQKQEKTVPSPSRKSSENQIVSYQTISREMLSLDRTNAQQNTTSGSSGVYQSNTPCVLIVEDNPVNLLVAEETLLDAHYRVAVATNGEDAIEKLEQGDIDLILMDCQMPVLDGFAATRRIRRTERDLGLLVSQQIPIVALTAEACKGDREKCLAAGMNDYIAKPFQAETLFSVLQQYIRKPETSEDASEPYKATGT